MIVFLIFFSPHNFNDLYKYKDCTLGKFTKLDEEGKALKRKYSRNI